MKFYITIFLLLSSLFCRAQRIDVLTDSLPYVIGINGTKLLCQRIFEYDKFNDLAVRYLIGSYRQKIGYQDNYKKEKKRHRYQPSEKINYKDSISMFFEKLIRENPNSPEPYNLSAKYECWFDDRCVINRLSQSLSIDSNNIEALGIIGNTYYRIFNNLINRDTLKDSLSFYAEKAYHYLKKQYIVDKQSIDSVQNDFLGLGLFYNQASRLNIYTLIQLANFLNKENKVLELRNDLDTIRTELYFPLAVLSSLPDQWEKDFKINIMNSISYGYFLYYWYMNILTSINESSIFQDSTGLSMFRFTCLRSFEDDIVIRLEKSDNKISLYWTKINNKTENDTGKRFYKGEKKLSEKQWKKFIDLLNEINYWNLSPQIDRLGFDGARWILEGKMGKKYHLVDRWSPEGGDYKRCCRYVMKLAGF